MVFVEAACCAVGGLLLLARKRWLWNAGALMNVLVIAICLGFHLRWPDVLYCVPGVLSKTA